jgi:bile salt-stimulated lipase
VSGEIRHKIIADDRISTDILQDMSGSEDCLFLNVYTPALKGSRAVMVSIHGGSFTSYSGNDYIYGPKYLMQEDVVVVTMNFRLGALGFLSTGDEASQGNYGMKDQVEALRWVRKNIANFGGNPDEVTIFGASSGSVSVLYHIISDMRSNVS